MLSDEIPGIVPRRPARPAWFDQLLTTSADHVAGDRFFFAGIDAGTSGIRVALHDEFNSSTALHAFGPNSAGGTRFSFPAVAGCDGDSFLFGNDAVALPPRKRFVSFKGAMLHPGLEQDLCERWQRLQLPYVQELCTNQAPSVADFLYSVSIARSVELALPELIPSARSKPAFLSFAVGAPFVGDDPVKRRFGRGFAAALLLAGSVGDRPNIARLVESCCVARREGPGLADAAQEERRIHVRSEAHCAILPLRRLFHFGRNFLIVDIGAATTDVSVVRIGIDQRPFCYASASAPVGVDTLDLLATSGSRAKEDVLSRRIHRGRTGSTRLSRGTRGEAEAKALEPLQRALSSVLHEAIRKNNEASGWRALNVIAVGGGSQVPALKRIVAEADSVHRYIQQRQTLGILVEPPRSVDSAPQSHEEHELVSVLGCAMPEWEIGEYGTPDQVEKVTPTYLKAEPGRRREWLPGR